MPTELYTVYVNDVRTVFYASDDLKSGRVVADSRKNDTCVLYSNPRQKAVYYFGSDLESAIRMLVEDSTRPARCRTDL